MTMTHVRSASYTFGDLGGFENAVTKLESAFVFNRAQDGV